MAASVRSVYSRAQKPAGKGLQSSWIVRIRIQSVGHSKSIKAVASKVPPGSTGLLKFSKR